MQKTLDGYFFVVQTVEETIPREWRENPIPKSPVAPKRPVGRPMKKKNDEAVEEAIMTRENDQSLSTVQSPKRGKYGTYSLKEKEEILEEAELCGLRVTARKWKIAPSTLGTWKKEVVSESSRNKNGRKVGSGRPLSYNIDTEEKIVAWIHEQRDKQVPVSRNSVKAYARSILKESNPNFLASDGWLSRFMDRNNFSLRKHTSLSQKLPGDLEVRLSVFYKHLKELRIEHELDEDYLLMNMDEVPMKFDTVPSCSVHTKGEKDVRVITTGGEKKHFTAVLAVNAAGDFLPSMVIFKGKRELKKVSGPPGWIVAVNEKAWVREDVMIRWIKEILRPYTQRRPSLLVLDSFSAHITPKVREELHKIQCHPAIIPGGCTSKAQPLDVAINKPLKDRIRISWTKFMQDRQEALNEGASDIKGPSHQDLLNWINDAMKEVKGTGVIPKSFKVTGISTALSGTEDHMLHNDDILSLDDADDVDEEFEGFGVTDMSESDDPFIDIDKLF